MILWILACGAMFFAGWQGGRTHQKKKDYLHRRRRTDPPDLPSGTF